MSRPDDAKQPGADADAAPERASGADEAATLAVAVEELRDKYLRAVAETENLRKRSERDIADARAYGIAGFARDMIGIADNLSRALEAIEPDARGAATGTLKALLDGVELTQRELQKALAKQKQATALSRKLTTLRSPISSSGSGGLPTEKLPGYIIDPPSPFAPIATWLAFLAQLEKLPQDDVLVQDMTKRAKRVIGEMEAAESAQADRS